jgi:glycosyltransferase involved in cell wall biosynthesis
MRILFIAPRLHTNYSGIIEHLRKKNKIYFNSIYSSKIEDHRFVKPKILQQGLISKILIILFGKKNIKFFYFPKFFDYYQYLKNINPDLIFLRITGRFNLYLNLIFLSFFDCKIICHEQKIFNRKENKNTSLKNLFLYYEWCLLSLIFKVRIFSPIYKNPDKFHFYLPFVTHIKKNKVLANKKTDFISIGRFEERKNLIFLISVLRELNFNFSLLIIGENSNNTHSQNLLNLKNYIKKYDLQKKIKIKTNIPFKKIKIYLKKKGLFILPSYDEPAAISLLEAISSGIPVLCSDTCGTKVYVKDNFNGFIFKSQNKLSLKRKISFYVKSKKKFNFYSKNCYDYSSLNLSTSNFNFYFQKILNSFKGI